jgi:hypothetical protein
MMAAETIRGAVWRTNEGKRQWAEVRSDVVRQRCNLPHRAEPGESEIPRPAGESAELRDDATVEKIQTELLPVVSCQRDGMFHPI